VSFSSYISSVLVFVGNTDPVGSVDVLTFTSIASRVGDIGVSIFLELLRGLFLDGFFLTTFASVSGRSRFLGPVRGFYILTFSNDFKSFFDSRFSISIICFSVGRLLFFSCL
jgi:hypothetical protein